MCPGRICVGEVTNSKPRLTSSRAFCEGMAYRADGTLLEKPSTNNPHAAGSEDATAWQKGWALAEHNKGGSISKDDLGCCAATSAIPA